MQKIENRSSGPTFREFISNISVSRRKAQLYVQHVIIMSSKTERFKILSKTMTFNRETLLRTAGTTNVICLWSCITEENSARLNIDGKMRDGKWVCYWSRKHSCTESPHRQFSASCIRPPCCPPRFIDYNNRTSKTVWTYAHLLIAYAEAHKCSIGCRQKTTCERYNVDNWNQKIIMWLFHTSVNLISGPKILVDL